MTDHMQKVREFAMRQRAAQQGAVDTSAHWTATCRVCGNSVQGTSATLHKGCPTCNAKGGPHA